MAFRDTFLALRQWLVYIFDRSSSCDKVFNFAPSVFCPQSLEVSKIKKNKKNFEKVWSSIINITKAGPV
jgi:hypothetical protein